MPTHRYPLSDGRQVEINAPITGGRAYIYVDGEFLGEETVRELRHPLGFTLADDSRLTVHIVSSIPFFRLFDVRHNGAPVMRSASDPIWSLRTAIEILIFCAISDIVWKQPVTPFHYAKDGFAALALLLAFLLWKDFDDAPAWTRAFMLIRCIAASVHLNDTQLGVNLDAVTLALYFWMRHLTNIIEYTPRPDPPMPAIAITSPHAS
jgi:hypothetical protein